VRSKVADSDEAEVSKEELSFVDTAFPEPEE
jgi:hypothetical protein